MKKLFISVPMKGRTEEAIKKSMEKMHKIAEIVFDQELEAIDSYIEEEAPADCVNPRLWYLGKSIEMMAEADYFVGVADLPFGVWPGCDTENNTAAIYNIPSTMVEMTVGVPEFDELGGVLA